MFNNHITEQTQNNLAHNMHTKLVDSLNPIILNWNDLNEQAKAPDRTLKKLVYLVEAHVLDKHAFKHKPSNIKDEIYIKALFANSVNSAIQNLIAKYRTSKLNWTEDSTQLSHFIVDYNAIIKRAREAYNEINQMMSLNENPIEDLIYIPLSGGENEKELLKKIDDTEANRNEKLNKYTKIDSKEKNQDGKTWKLDIAEIKAIQDKKIAYLESLPKQLKSIEKVQNCINADFKAPERMDNGDYARALLAEALMNELETRKALFDDRTVENNKEAIKQYYEDVKKILEKAKKALSDINNKFNQDPQLVLDSAITTQSRKCHQAIENLKTFADLKVYRIKKPKGWLAQQLNSNKAEKIRYCEKSEFEAKTRELREAAKTSGKMIGTIFLGLGAAAGVAAGASASSAGGASLAGEAGVASGRAAVELAGHEEKKKSWQPPRSKLTDGSYNQGIAYAVRADIPPKDILGTMSIDATGKPFCSAFPSDASEKKANEKDEILYIVESLSEDTLSHQGTGHQIGEKNKKGQVMVFDNLSDAFALCDVRNDGLTYSQELGWRKFESWKPEERANVVATELSSRGGPPGRHH